MTINDLHPMLENRTDLEQLEKDLAQLTGPNAGPLGAGVQQRIQSALRDLEIGRANHIEMCFKLIHPESEHRNKAHQELLQRISNGERKIYDPVGRCWRWANELLIEYNLHEADVAKGETQNLLFETVLKNAVDSVQKLRELRAIITRAEELERIHGLSANGLDLLQKARRARENIERQHQQVLSHMRHGSLIERSWAIEAVRQLKTSGETEIWESSTDRWNGIDPILNEAIQAHKEESARRTELLLRKAATQMKTQPDQALKTLYEGLDQTIPYTEEDRQRLETSYMEQFGEYKNHAGVVPPPGQPIAGPDLEGFKKTQELIKAELIKQFNESSKWMDVNHLTLTRQVSVLLEYAARKEVPVAKTIDFINMAEGLARKQMEDSLEIPGAMIRGSVILFNKNEPALARDKLEKALPLYKRDRKDILHRHAVTAWLLGCLEYYLGRRIHGYVNWTLARKEFNDLLIRAEHARPIYWYEWYKPRLKEMDIARVQTFEVMYSDWLNTFGLPHLPVWLNRYREIIKDQFNTGKHAELRLTLHDMLRDASREANPEYVWLSQVEAAFFEYQLHDYKTAIVHLDQAGIGFQFEHRAAVILWMVGMIRWWLPSQRPDAILNWEESIQRFKNLAKQADQANKQDRRVWYEKQAEIMQTCLLKWINLFGPSINAAP